MKRTTILSALAALALCGCGDDGAAPTDAGVGTPPPGVQLTAGGGRVNSATYTLDIQFGHGLEQRPARSAGYHLEPHTIIKP